jgi:ABC-type sugar transport system ATPase subunit
MESLSQDNAITATPLLRLNGVNYSRDNISVLKDINLELYRSEFHAIVGDHGSGKSSLGMIIGGILKPASGKIILDGKSYSSLSLKRAHKLNIQMVTQEIHLINYFSVAENLLMPDKVYNLIPLKKRNLLIQEAQELLQQYGFNIEPLAIINNLPISDRMVVHILRSIYKKPGILILDAVLEKLAPVHLEKIFELLRSPEGAGYHHTVHCPQH